MRTAPEEKNVLNPTEAIKVFGLSARRFYQSDAQQREEETVPGVLQQAKTDSPT